MNLIESGLIRYWQKKYKKDDVCDDVTKMINSRITITVEDSFWIFVVLATGLGLAVLALITECTY